MFEFCNVLHLRTPLKKYYSHRVKHMCNTDFKMLYRKKSHSLTILENCFVKNLDMHFLWTLTKISKLDAKKSFCVCSETYIGVL